MPKVGKAGSPYHLADLRHLLTKKSHGGEGNMGIGRQKEVMPGI